MTINISLPKKLLADAKRVVNEKGYASISELMRDALRHKLYPGLTENGFTPEFEEAVLRAAKEPRDNDIVLRTDKDIENYFMHLKYPPKRLKSKRGK
ncbi:hypothetical protein A2773_05345 [Candidatus Gottesmanbacteria bacterium RIFCSPHIGHO2_01_FULL_39_10]|uniref:Ribbon-helix-helix protein CopG domain-containing protein n=1 Tax=Candidatus Gottesmanbacteria bacterium RIFCSPHIGHO2_01_FULL_39_10 TaxID=1798375 RepID=A0A1F5ZNR3_9BACT|nr:MAG: hypothetical protein A2773_05345 [Candidatus Gottesmanbacteria bacterium RIFCSPHIGHO2_01_FULL_39_10]